MRYEDAVGGPSADCVSTRDYHNEDSGGLPLATTNTSTQGLSCTTMQALDLLVLSLRTRVDSGSHHQVLTVSPNLMLLVCHEASGIPPSENVDLARLQLHRLQLQSQTKTMSPDW